MTRKYIFGCLFFAAFFIGSSALALTEIIEEVHVWHFDQATIEKGYTIASPDEIFHVGVLPGVLKGETDVTIKVFDHQEYEEYEIYQVFAGAEPPAEEVIEEEKPTRLTVDWAVPEGKQVVSPVYEFDIKGAADLYNPEVPLWLRFHYQHGLTNLGVYFWDKGHQQWIGIPTDINEQDDSLRAAIHLTYAPMVILADEIAEVGEASWYRYQNCNCAASRDYPAGTLLEVTHIGTGNQVIVEVNDYGPELWTGRIIDLDLVAFEQLVSKGYGITQVMVKPYIITEEEFENSELTYDPL